MRKRSKKRIASLISISLFATVLTVSPPNTAKNTVAAELQLSMLSDVSNVISESSSFNRYGGEWTETRGVYVNGKTMDSKYGTFSYTFFGSQSNIYATQDCKAEIRIDGGAWKRVILKGSNKSPSYTVITSKEGQHAVDVRGVGDKIALNMISSNGFFIKSSSSAAVPESPKVSLALNNTKATLYVTGSKMLQLKATVKGTTQSVQYSSSNTKVAKVDKYGKVTAVKSGTATIRVKANGLTKNCKIVVKNQVWLRKNGVFC